MSQGMTTRQVAAKLCCSDDQVRALIASGQLAASNIGLGSQRARWLILQESLEEFLRRRQTHHAAAIKRMTKPKRAARKEWV